MGLRSSPTKEKGAVGAENTEMQNSANENAAVPEKKKTYHPGGMKAG